MATTLTADLSIERADTVPNLEVCCDDGHYALSIGNEIIEVKLIGDLAVLNQLIDNCRAALDSLQFCQQARKVS